MVTTFLSDEVISSTDLRANQKYWLDRASENVITIVNGRKKFALINREHISNLYAQKYYSEIILRYCKETNTGVSSVIFPWIEHLSNEERDEFYNELLNCAMESTINNDWSLIEQLIEDWKATAEVNSSPTLARTLLEKEDPSKYVRIKD